MCDLMHFAFCFLLNSHCNLFHLHELPGIGNKNMQQGLSMGERCGK